MTVRSGNELEVTTDKKDEEKDIQSEYVPTEKESEQAPKEMEEVDKKKESYVPLPPYKPQIVFPQMFAKEKIKG